jgi:hypothetical protein
VMMRVVKNLRMCLDYTRHRSWGRRHASIIRGYQFVLKLSWSLNGQQAFLIWNAVLCKSVAQRMKSGLRQYPTPLEIIHVMFSLVCLQSSCSNSLCCCMLIVILAVGTTFIGTKIICMLCKVCTFFFWLDTSQFSNAPLSNLLFPGRLLFWERFWFSSYIL